MTENSDMKRNAWKSMDEKQVQAAFEFCRGYVDFLNTVKTEREAVNFISQAARKCGFVPLDEIDKIKPGQKVLIQNKGKVCGLAVIGHDLGEGFNLVASHIDSPRLDLKPRPLYEADGLALFKTHYYGGIKKYQWLAIPLAMHGVVVKKDGSIVNISLGEVNDEFSFTITDLLPHLAKDQMEKKMVNAVKGEDLNIIVGSRPGDQEKEPIKEQLADLIKEKYGLEEDDFISAELEMVPAFKATEIGLDRSMVGAYGQDDRVCAYTSLMAALSVDKPERTALCLFVDKEEIGSMGNTGLQSLIIENIMVELMHKSGKDDYYSTRKALKSSCALSADVNAAVDPNYPEVYEKMNCSFLGEGIAMSKYTGARGKYDSSDANPEFVGKVRKLFDDNKVKWQVGELGKVDLGGGGTVAQYMARYGMEVVDCGVALLGMHSPFEVSSKADVYMAYEAYKSFLQRFK